MPHPNEDAPNTSQSLLTQAAVAAIEAQQRAAEDVRNAGEAFAAATRRCMDLHRQKAEKADAAIERIKKAGPNPKTDRPHSTSSADEIKSRDPEYGAFLQEQGLAEQNRLNLLAGFIAAHHRAGACQQAAAMVNTLLGKAPATGDLALDVLEDLLLEVRALVAPPEGTPVGGGPVR